MEDLERLQTLATQAEISTWVLTTIAIILFVLRWTARLFCGTKTGLWEDIVLVASWVFDISRQSMFQQAVISIRQLRPDNFDTQLSTAAFWTVLTACWAQFTIMVPKLAVCLLLIRIFKPRVWVRNLLLTTAIGLTLAGFIGSFLTLFGCNPAAATWNPPKYPNAKCGLASVSLYWSVVDGLCAAILDLAYVIYPVAIIWKLQMPLKKRLLAMAAMSLGVASCAVASVREYYVFARFKQQNPIEALYTATYISFWCAIENEFILSAACLPLVPTCFRSFKKYLTSRSSKPSYDESFASGKIMLTQTWGVETTTETKFDVTSEVASSHQEQSQ